MTQPPGYPPPPSGYPPPPPPGYFPPPPPQPYSERYWQPYPPPRPPATNWWAIISLVTGVLVVLVGTAVVVLVVANEDKIFERNAVNAADVGLGDCLSEIPSDSSLVASVQTVACTEPHKGEVYFALTVPGSEFPGETEIIDYQDRCQPALEEFSPSAMANPEVGMFVLYPTADSWKRGDRAVTCIATTDVPRTGSLQE